MRYYNFPEGKDPQLWHIAHKRASFKKHLLTYVIINIFFWVLWFFSKDSHKINEGTGLPWPVWPAIGWGIGLVFHYIGAYVSTDNSVEKEYDKLKNQNK
ncbi:MAG: 2TM domain-containing protein [Flavisolibacter sp.]